MKKTAKLVIPGKLPGLNEYILAERTNRMKAAEMKRDTEYIIRLAARQQLHGVRCYRAPVVMHYTWIEKNRKRDKDNIAFARKFIQDALVRAGILENDGWDQIAGFEDEFKVDARNPRVEVVITEMERDEEAGH